MAAACYTLRDQHGSLTDFVHGETLLPWYSTRCDAAVLQEAQGTREWIPLAQDTLPQQLSASTPMNRPNGTGWTVARLLAACKRPGHREPHRELPLLSSHKANDGMDLQEACPGPSHSQGDSGPTLPTQWSYCANDEESGKPSPAVAAFHPGAILLLSLPTSWLPSTAYGPHGTAAFNVSLQYLSSWRPMGTVHVSCLSGCSCANGVRINAWHVSSVRNATIFRERVIPVWWHPQLASSSINQSNNLVPSTPHDGDCILSVYLEQSRASSSTTEAGILGSAGRHRFKIRSVVLTTTQSPCKDKSVQSHFLQTRSGLKCHGP